MNGWSELDEFLRTDPRDVGCAQAMKMMHIYADLVAAGASVQERYPGFAAHLRSVRPVRRGLRRAAGRIARRG